MADALSDIRADGEPLSARWPRPVTGRDPEVCAWLAELSQAARTGEVTLSFPPHRAPEISEPGAWNLVGDAAFAVEWPLSWNYLDPRSPNYPLKQLQKQIYLRQTERWLGSVPTGARVLDIGGGIGRFSAEWLKRGLAVTLADPNPDALVLALGHLAQAGGDFDLRHLAAESLAPLPSDHFGLISAMEVFCYLSRPQDGMREAARVLRPGGTLICSVESPVGALEPGQRHDRAAIADVLEGPHERALPGDTWVQYFTAETLRQSLSDAGLEVEAVLGTHYLPDGPMHHLVDFDRLGDPAYEASLLTLEEELAHSLKWRDAARAWVGVARKPLCL